MLARTYKAKYLPRTPLKEYAPKPYHSWTWRAIANPQSTELHKGRWIVGVGHQIPLTHPDWFQASSNTLRELNLTNGTMVDLIVPNPKSWNCNLLRKLYPHPICIKIMKTPIPKTGDNLDKLVWKHSTKGDYSVAQAYSLLQQLQTTSTDSGPSSLQISQSNWKLFWKVKLLARILTCV